MKAVMVVQWSAWLPPIYSDNPSSNPDEVYNFFCKINENEAANGPFKNTII